MNLTKNHSVFEKTLPHNRNCRNVIKVVKAGIVFNAFFADPFSRVKILLTESLFSDP